MISGMLAQKNKISVKMCELILLSSGSELEVDEGGDGFAAEFEDELNNDDEYD